VPPTPPRAGALLRSFRPGDTVVLDVIRDGAEVEVTMTLSGSS
jgi:S1-C subfamily serine protease